jgi:hypothetical protein
MKLFLAMAALLALCACGVKGDPLPPEKPVELGRGRPTYKRAMKNVKVSPVKEDPEDEEKSDKDAEDAE